MCGAITRTAVRRTDLRAGFGRRYLGIEIEVNQRFPKGDADRWRRLRRLLIVTFREAL